MLILDQFEELFTLSDPKEQARFAVAIGRIRDEVDIHVVLSLRDDFFFHCHKQPAFAGAFETVVPIGPLKGEALRRALVRPALNCDYRFEDESLVDDMLREVAGERGALPLLAFAVSRLWDKRDHEQRLLTRAAYEEIGGVGGALAQHAEATMERIGSNHQHFVREIFRNLVTARGTRVVRRREELLSVFPPDQLGIAAEILRNLIRARLLTSYETGSVTPVGEQQVEIIHESLLTHWPRLVRWQTQDADSAQLRDQLRRSARMWSERGRREDLLWQGTTYQEFRVWRAQYTGGLSDIESGFAAAMTELAGRRRRRRRIAVIAAFSVLVAFIAAGSVLWRQSETDRKRAIAEARRSEAGKLLVLGQAALDECPTNAVAYAEASLELADMPETRRFAQEALCRGPTLFHLPSLAEWNPWAIEFSPDGRWFAVGWSRVGGVWIYSLEGGPPRQLIGHRLWVLQTAFGPDSDILVTTATDSTIRVWSVPDGALLQKFEVGAPSEVFIQPDGRSIVSCAIKAGEPHVWQSWPLDGEIRFLSAQRATRSPHRWKRCTSATTQA